MTIREWMKALYYQKERLPVTDAFISDYQQEGGAYITLAKSNGHPVDKKAGEPNQKWLFYYGYLTYHILNTKKFSIDNDISAIWNGSTLKCPELVLWLAEASGVDEQLLLNASRKMKEIIDTKNYGAARSSGLARASAAAELMRMIPAENIEIALCKADKACPEK
ncbi:MAG: hypothetical protein MJ070_06695 [Lachnospiraceae bacterium]|nr:hypothetical protein [Lachnospiraceae bacterium]